MQKELKPERVFQKMESLFGTSQLYLIFFRIENKVLSFDDNNPLFYIPPFKHCSSLFLMLVVVVAEIDLSLVV